MSKKEFGRSMIEMLGVLAIIGVLSALGIWGYRSAINKYKANQTIYDVNMIAAVIMSADKILVTEGNDSLDFSEYKNPTSGYVFQARKETDGVFSVSALDVPKGVCNKIKEVASSDFFISVNNENYLDTNDATQCEENNRVNFYFDMTNAVKCGKKICYGGRACISEECLCPEHQSIENGICKCDAGYPIKCGNECFQTCPEGSEFDCTTKTCKCQETTHIFKNGTCVCPSGKEEGADGKCHTKACSGGTSGNQDWTCYIDEQRCGYQCTENGLTCNYGICDKGICPSGLTHAYHTGKNIFGCKNANGVTCMRGEVGNAPFCYLNDTDTQACGGSCSTFKPESCNYGLCDPSQCKDGTYFGKMTAPFGYGNLSGCWKNDGSLQCSNGLGSSLFICVTSEKVICGHECTYDGHCGINFCPKEECEADEMYDETSGNCIAVCPQGTTYRVKSNTSQCVRNSDGVYCALGTSDSGLQCWFSDGKKCGLYCTWDASSCRQGTCNTSDCPPGLTLKNIYSVSAGCYNEQTKIGCYPTNYGASLTCYKDGVKCTQGTCSDYYGTGCCEDVWHCPAGTNKVMYMNLDSCYNPLYETTCRIDSYCYRQNVQCGYGCNLNGTGCTSSSKCVETECGAGKTLAIVNGTWSCQNTELTCTDGSCSINGSKCGTGCNDDGTSCSYGVCSVSECPAGTYLAKVDTNTFGCKSPIGIACYPEDGSYTCSKGGTICATGCESFNSTNQYNCTISSCNE